jgi:2-iminobutanoate/2-iminopropanoate deaminase
MIFKFIRIFTFNKTQQIKNTMKQVQTSLAPVPAGHYSQGIIHNDIVYVSGQLSIDPSSRLPVQGTVEEQLTQALNNMLAVLIEAGSEKEKVLKCTVFISDIALWPRVNEVYADFFGNHKPARSVVPVNTLHHGLIVEVEAIAAV